MAWFRFPRSARDCLLVATSMPGGLRRHETAPAHEQGHSHGSLRDPTELVDWRRTLTLNCQSAAEHRVRAGLGASTFAGGIVLVLSTALLVLDSPLSCMPSRSLNQSTPRSRSRDGLRGIVPSWNRLPACLKNRATLGRRHATAVGPCAWRSRRREGRALSLRG